MTTEITLDTLHQNFDEIFADVESRQASFLIVEENQPVAALIDIGLFNRIRQLPEFNSPRGPAH